MTELPSGATLFARYAFAPNELGYCGPAHTEGLFALGAGLDRAATADPYTLARRFSGAWPYLRILADLLGADPLDEPVVRAYWVGSPLLDRVDPHDFGERLLAAIGPQAGHYWAHLTPSLLAEAAPTHGFHVFGVYPWSRLLTSGPSQAELWRQPLSVLDDCRVRWGQVVSVEPEHVLVESRRLGWDGARLSLLPPATERVRRVVQGVGFVADPQPGEWLALHWDWVCDRLSETDVAQLGLRTGQTLAATNRRLVGDVVREGGR